VTDCVRFGVWPQVFGDPYPEPAQVDLARLKLKRTLPGIKLDVQKSLALLQELSAYVAEVDQFLKNRPASLPHWGITYPACDSATLYAMLRHLKPKRYIEVGCGYSSRCSAAALAINKKEGRPCESAFIEPYPPPYLTEMNLPGEFLQQRIEQVPLERFQQLEADDVLFIDTSHVIKVQNDVEYELLHVLPLLQPGVVVHIHDIFTPYDYPEEWLVGHGPNRGGNNEQYALECLLSGGGDWEVTLPVHLLWREHRQLLKRLVDSDDRPAAFWIRKMKSCTAP
jgi:Methyltransferase domain